MTEKIINKRPNGMLALVLLIIAYIAAIVLAVLCGLGLENEGALGTLYGIGLAVFAVYLIVGWLLFGGLKTLKPQEALVLTLFGKYYGTLRAKAFTG